MGLGLWVVGFRLWGMRAGIARIASMDSIPAMVAIWAIVPVLP